MSRLTQQYIDAQKMSIDVGDAEKFEYMLQPFNLVMSKVAGYMPAPERSKAAGQPITGVFIDSDYIFVAIDTKKFEQLLIKHLENDSK